MQTACYIRSDATFRHVQETLAPAGFECHRFTAETAMMHALRRRQFDVILIDTEYDAAEGNGIYSWLNCRTGESTPVVMLSSAQSADHIVRVLDAGASDFIQQPFAPVDLIARMHAVLRRGARKNKSRTIVAEGFVLDESMSTLHDHGRAIELTPREFKMAWLFFSSPGINLSRETISTAIWGVDSEIAARTIEQHIYKLRKKLKLCSERGVRIRTTYTRGYRLEVCAAAMDEGRERNQMRLDGFAGVEDAALASGGKVTMLPIPPARPANAGGTTERMAS